MAHRQVCEVQDSYSGPVRDTPETEKRSEFQISHDFVVVPNRSNSLLELMRGFGLLQQSAKIIHPRPLVRFIPHLRLLPRSGMSTDTRPPSLRDTLRPPTLPHMRELDRAAFTQTIRIISARVESSRISALRVHPALRRSVICCRKHTG